MFLGRLLILGRRLFVLRLRLFWRQFLQAKGLTQTSGLARLLLRLMIRDLFRRLGMLRKLGLRDRGLVDFFRVLSLRRALIGEGQRDGQFDLIFDLSRNGLANRCFGNWGRGLGNGFSRLASDCNRRRRHGG